ncbi:MAG TPA: sigma-70 family RNA polymerase sigma factor [Mycobacteriales bacterium]|nr:sigma-70 family RNA polymerase sigma factor [Mycobacteriales bacterium]
MPESGSFTATSRPDKQGGLESFRLLVEENQAAIYAFVRRRVADAARAEDVTQEVFLRAWRNAERFDASRAEPRAWLLAIARNLVIDSYRADAARPRTGGSLAALAAIPAPDDLAAAMASWTMSGALAALTQDHRDVLLCLYYRGWTLAETAAHLGVALGTVKSRSTYALRALRLVLEEMEASG